MANLVHQQCSGRLSLHMPSSPLVANEASAQSAVYASDLPTSSAYSGWLAHNAVLLHSLTLPCWQVSEDCIAEGLQAACAAAAAAATCGGGSATSPAASTSSLLPLKSLTCNIPSRGHILCGLFRAAHLTSLWMRVAAESPVPGCEVALAGLTSLQHLTLGMDSEDLVQTIDVVRQWLPGLARLTRLTYLNLQPTESQGGRAIHAACVIEGTGHLLPASLMDLGLMVTIDLTGASAGLKLGHLTAVTALHVRNVFETDVMPPNVELLTVCNCGSMQPLLPRKLPHLRELTVDGIAAGVLKGGGLLRLTQLSNFQALRLKVSEPYQSYLRALPRLASLPVCELDCTYNCRFDDAAVVAFLTQVGSFSSLTRLSLTKSWHNQRHLFDWSETAVRTLAAQLPRLSVLQELHVHTKPAARARKLALDGPASSAAPKDWQVLVKALVDLTSLRHVELSDCSLHYAASQLSAATQLTRLVLRDCLPDSDMGIKEQLCSAKNQLMPDGIVVTP